MGKDLKGKDLGKGFSQRKDGRYEARATINGIKIDIYDTNLTSLRKNFEAEKLMVLREEKNIRPNNTTLEDWYTEWFQKCKAPQLKSVTSRRTYDRKVRNTYVKLLGKKALKDISQLNIQTATNELVEKGYVERSIREALGVIRECYDTAIVNHVASTNPCVSINIKDANTQHERRVMTQEEQTIFLNEVRNRYYYEAYAFLLLTGVRIGEFSGLQWGDIDFVNKKISIKRTLSTTYMDGKKIEEISTPKTACAYRDIPFFGETESLLKNWKIKQEKVKAKMGDRWRCKPEFGDLVFTSTVGSPVTRYIIVHDLKSAVDNINMKEMYTAMAEGRVPVKFEHLHPHAFRHTFATRCFEKGLSPLFIQRIMGHSNYTTTVSYTHLLEDVNKKEIEKAGNFFD